MNSHIRILFLLFFLSPCLSFALDQTGGVSLTQGLTQGLSDLKNSVDHLAVSDDQLALKNAQLKTLLSGLENNLKKVNAENQELTSQKNKLDSVNAIKTKQSEQLEKNISDLDHKTDEIKDKIKSAQDGLASEKQADQQLNDQIDHLLKPGASSDPNSPSPELSELIHQKEKQKLAALKMISEIQAHQELLNEQILDFQKNVPLSVQGGPNMSKKISLENQIEQLQAETSQLNSLVHSSPSMQGWGEAQMHQLETNVRDLEKNRDELKDLVAKMQQKAQNTHLVTVRKDDQAKLASGMDKLKGESKELKIDFEELQQQMVELDKRKTYLEALFRKEP